MPVDPVHLSKFLSFVLRHKPDAIGLRLDSQGWASIDELLAKSDATGTRFSLEDLLQIIATSDKKRFSLSEDGQRIRAAQGHSVTVELGLAPQEPPSIRYHGNATRFVDLIRSEGLRPQARQQVHLSADEATAHRVGQRHGKPVILKRARTHEPQEVRGPRPKGSCGAESVLAWSPGRDRLRRCTHAAAGLWAG